MMNGNDGVMKMIPQAIADGGAAAAAHPLRRNGLAIRRPPQRTKAVADKYDPRFNCPPVDMTRASDLRPSKVVSQYSTSKKTGEDKHTQRVCPAALGARTSSRRHIHRTPQLLYVPTNHVCMATSRSR